MQVLIDDDQLENFEAAGLTTTQVMIFSDLKTHNYMLKLNHNCLTFYT